MSALISVLQGFPLFPRRSLGSPALYEPEGAGFPAILVFNPGYLANPVQSSCPLRLCESVTNYSERINRVIRVSCEAGPVSKNSLPAKP